MCISKRINPVQTFLHFSYTEDNFKGGRCLLSGDAPSNVSVVESDRFSLHLRLARCPLQVKLYTLGRPLSCDVLFCSLSEVPFTNLSEQWLAYQPNRRAGGTCQKCFTKHYDCADAPECIRFELIFDKY